MLKVFFSIFIGLFLTSSFAEDLGGSVLGNEVEDLLQHSNSTEKSAYIDEEADSLVDHAKSVDESPIVPSSVTQDHMPTLKPVNEFKDVGYTVPGSFEGQENYIDIDKDLFSKKVKNHSSSAFNFSYIRDSFNYQSPNNIIQRTIAEGYKHTQSGFLLLRSDNYFYQSRFANLHWSLGAGLAFNYGRGIFTDGVQSDAQFRLWEIPIDLGFGLEIPITHIFKISATAGPSIMGLIQNRSDLTDSESGKNKLQIGFGQFVSAQFKFNLAEISGENSYELFATNQITNLFFTFDVRYHSYDHYLEQIKISGTSLGGGITFEFL